MSSHVTAWGKAAGTITHNSTPHMLVQWLALRVSWVIIVVHNCSSAAHREQYRMVLQDEYNCAAHCLFACLSLLHLVESMSCRLPSLGRNMIYVSQPVSCMYASCIYLRMQRCEDQNENSNGQPKMRTYLLDLEDEDGSHIMLPVCCSLNHFMKKYESSREMSTCSYSRFRSLDSEP